jgi:hypothetical protein
MDLKDFPMDSQRCPLKIGSCKLEFFFSLFTYQTLAF